MAAYAKRIEFWLIRDGDPVPEEPVFVLDNLTEKHQLSFQVEYEDTDADSDVSPE